VGAIVDQAGKLHDEQDGRFLGRTNARPATGLTGTETNWERLQREARITDPADPAFNSDMDVIVAGLRVSYRETILAGIEPTDEDAYDELRDRSLHLPWQDAQAVRTAQLAMLAERG